LLRNPFGVVSLAYLTLVVAAAALASVLAPDDPDRASAGDLLQGPSSRHWLGTDGSGHDIFSRLLYATRLSLSAALVALAVAALIGVTAGLLAGYYGKTWEVLASWMTSLLMALPAIVVLLAARTVLGPSIWSAMVVFGILVSPAFYRLVYGTVAAVREELYVDAARVFGLSDARIIGRHILRVVRAPVIILAAGITGIAIAIQAGLDFLGLGDLSKPSWGGMLNDAFASIYTKPLNLLWPSLAIGLTSVALALLGNALRDELERSASPRRRGRLARGGPEGESNQSVESDRVVIVVHEDATPDETSRPLLAVESLAVGYDQRDGSVTTVVRDVSLTVRRGEVHGLIGESGSGKTQTAFAVMRLLPAGGRVLAGRVQYDGRDLSDLSDQEMRQVRGARIAYVPQEPMSNLDPAFTVGSQLIEPMRCNGMSKAEATEKGLGLLARVGIPDPARAFAAYPHQISGGMAQRVLIAGAISCEPDLLIADEPTTALDVTVQAEVLDLLRSLQKELGMGVLLVTHNFGVVADICDRVSVMQAGRIVESASVGSLFADPRHEYTRSLFAAALHGSTPREPLAGADEANALRETQ
jgi:peptide/nickel transport system permease protein